MKESVIPLSVITAILISGFIVGKHEQTLDTSAKIEQIDIRRHTMTIEEVDAECRLYRIDITSPEELEERPYIDYNIKVKFQTVVLRNLDRDSIINMIREECPDNITSITVRF